jgi:uncharacterized repeat protein (TIGR01451 family)
MKREFIRLGVFLLSILLAVPAYSVLANDSNEILLKSRHFIPQRGITSSEKANIEAISQKAHVLISLDRYPTIEDTNHLESKGVKLLSYIPNKSWFASIPSDKISDVLSIPNVRAISEILPEDKISPHIRAGNLFEPGIKDGKTAFIIEFFEDVPAIEIEETIARHDGLIIGLIPPINAVEAILQVEEGIALAFEESVKWLEQELPLEPLNNGIRAAIGVNNVQAAPFNLNGAGVNVLVYDEALVDNSHSDFGNRVIWGEEGYLGGHPTHVAGTMGGNGTLSSGKYRGMAPAVNIRSYHYDCDDDPCTICLYDDWISKTDMYDNFLEGVDTYDVNIITASVGFQPARRSGVNCDYEGDYSVHAQTIDSFISSNHIPVTWAVANERGYKRCGTKYHTISPTATAKNAIVVGAVNSNDNSMTGFSSWGPTDDGRIKPDIVAPGCENDPCGFGVSNDPNKSIWSTLGSSYGGYCGTSMATPAVAGSIALMLQQWKKTPPVSEPPYPAAIKAILINTAIDLGNPGPDYSFGYGLIDVRAAINLISDENTIKIYESITSPTEFTIEVPLNTPELKVTLAWDDIAGYPGAETSLVNKFDLIVKDPNGARYYPWILNPNNPDADANRGEDHTNNVEQVCVAFPFAGTWTLGIDVTYFQEGSCGAVVWGFPKFFHLIKEDNVPDGNKVSPGDIIIYSINYKYPLDHNIGDINNVIITDFLPVDLAFISASGPNSVYNPRSNTVIWTLGTLYLNDSCSVTLTAKVNDCITECGVITNSCKIEAYARNARWASENTPVLCASSPSPICGEASDFLCTGAPDLNLTWCPGRFAASADGHEVYLGTIYNDVPWLAHKKLKFSCRRQC